MREGSAGFKGEGSRRPLLHGSSGEVGEVGVGVRGEVGEVGDDKWGHAVREREGEGASWAGPVAAGLV
jgi:hypothetical protein